MNFDCTDSEKFYELNRILGLKEETSTEEITSNELAPISSHEINKSKSGQKLTEIPIIKENNSQRFKVPARNTINTNHILTPIATTRNQNAHKKTTTTPFVSISNTDRVSPQTTNFRESTGETTMNEFIASTTFPPINIAQFFELTTRRPFNFLTTTYGENTEYTTASTVADTEQSTRANFVPDLYETNNQSKADEVVDSIKQLQKLFPSSADDSREKRFLFKSDSVKNRQKLFEMLNHH